MTLQSDSSKRGDIAAIKIKDYEEAEKVKNQLEELQRHDKKLREMAIDKRRGRF